MRRRDGKRDDSDGHRKLVAVLVTTLDVVEEIFVSLYVRSDHQ